MKKFLAALGLSVLVFGGVAIAAPAQPAECSFPTSTYTEVNGNAGYIKGTSGNDYIVVNGNYNYVTAGGGRDCIVVTGEANYVKGDNGADVILSTGTRGALRGEAGADYIKGGSQEAIRGGAGVDTCVYNPVDSSAKECEL